MVSALAGSYGGIPDTVRSDPALLKLFLPTLRADLTLLETYTYRSSVKLHCPVTAFGGLGDPYTTSSSLEAWADLSHGSFRLEMFDGDHFFLNPLRNELLREVERDLTPYIASGNGGPSPFIPVADRLIANMTSNGTATSPDVTSRAARNVSAIHATNTFGDAKVTVRNGAVPGAAEAHAIVFPGQGSQRVGMGKDLFEAHPREVDQAESILGYSLRELCLRDPRRELHLTRFTQPALFVVNALTYISRAARGGREPSVACGHSLGEYNALFAAGVFDFATGVRLVKRRGELMSEVSDGAMLAVIGLAPDIVRTRLDEQGLDTVDIANMNSATQVVLAGRKDDIRRAGELLAGTGVRCVALNVSAAFHSRYMMGPAAVFAEYLKQFQFNAPKFTVIANATAQPYPDNQLVIRDLLARQIASPVRWYESVSYLLAQNEASIDIEELGPGKVLSKLVADIRTTPHVSAPSATADDSGQFAKLPTSGGSVRVEAVRKARVAFLYTGQGSQYFTMGASLYRENAAFRRAFDQCSALASPSIGTSLVDAVFHTERATAAFDRVLISNPALFAFGYAMTEALGAEHISPDLVVGYGVGEYVASVVAGALDLHDGMHLAIEQARLLEQSAPEGAMLAVFDDCELMTRHASVFSGCHLAGVSFQKNFVVSGAPNVIREVARKLKQMNVVTFPLPIRYGLYSPMIDSIEHAFRAVAGRVTTRRPRIEVHSPATHRWEHAPGPQEMWSACRKPVDFPRTVRELEARGVERYVDVGPSGTLASFVKHTLGDAARTVTVLTRFAAEPTSIEAAARALREPLARVA